MSGVDDYAEGLRRALQIGNEGDDTVEMLILRTQEALAGMVGSFAEQTEDSDHPALEHTHAELATVGLYLSAALGALHSARDTVTQDYLPAIIDGGA